MQQLIYYQELSLHVSGIYMPIFRSAGRMLLHMVFSTRCCGCCSKEPVRGLVQCVGLYLDTWTCRCPKYVEIIFDNIS